MTKLMKKSKSGFTLVELVIVIAILAIVAAIAIPTVSGVIGNANASADASNAQTIEMAIKQCQAEGAADSTTKSTIFETLKNNIKTDNKLTTLLAAYSISLNLNTLRTSDNEYYYDSNTGRVVAADADTTAKDKDHMNITNTPAALSNTSTFSISAANVLTITA